VLGVYTYDNLGRLTGLTRGNGVVTSWGYGDGDTVTVYLTPKPTPSTVQLAHGKSRFSAFLV
jgi:hypothetical protein